MLRASSCIVIGCAVLFCLAFPVPASADQPANTFVYIYDQNDDQVAHGGTYDPPAYDQPYVKGHTYQDDWQVTVDYPGGETGVKLLTQMTPLMVLGNQPYSSGGPTEFIVNMATKRAWVCLSRHGTPTAADDASP